jgi:hypothetical protein
VKLLHVFLVDAFLVDAFLCSVVDELPVHLMGLFTPATLLAVIVVAVSWSGASGSSSDLER